MTIPLTSIFTDTRDKDGYDRQRTDYGDLEALASSISRYGLLQPLVLMPDTSGPPGTTHRLIAGGRRLAAIRTLKWEEAPAVLVSEIPDAIRQEMELEENIRRKDLDWRERTKAVARIHNLRRHNAALSSEKWGYRETAELLGLSGHASVHYAVEVSRYLLVDAGGHPLYPKIYEAGSLRDALDQIVTIKREEALRALASKTPKAAPKTVTRDIKLPVEKAPEGDLEGFSLSIDGLSRSTSIRVEVASYKDLLPSLQKDGTPARYIYTDPPYAIDMDMLEQDNTGMDVSLVRATHDVNSNIVLLIDFLEIAYRTSTDHAWLVFWCDQDNWGWLKDKAEEYGWRVQRWPFVWIKPTFSSNQMAACNFTKCTEIAMICSKPGSTLAKNAPQNFYIGSNDKPNYKPTNPFWKPLDLHRQIITAIAPPGSTIVDPFCGSGSIPLAAFGIGYDVVASDIDETHIADLKLRMKL